MQQGEGQRQRGERHVAAAQIEQPGDRIRGPTTPPHRSSRRPVPAPAPPAFGPRSCRQNRPDGVQPGRTGPAADRTTRRPAGCPDRRSIGPGLVASLAEKIDPVWRMEPRIVAQCGVGGQRLFEPCLDRLFHQMKEMEAGPVDFRRRLQGITSVGKHGRLIFQNDGRARRSGKAGQPGNRCAEGGTYSPWCSSLRGTTKPSRPRWLNSWRRRSNRSPKCSMWLACCTDSFLVPLTL